MAKKSANIDRGKLLEERVTKSGLSITEITRRAGYKRGTYYQHINKPDLKLDIMERYGYSLPYDFSIDIPEMVIFLEHKKNLLGSSPITTFAEIEKDRDFWRNEYGRVLKENNALKAEINELNNEIKTLKSKK